MSFFPFLSNVSLSCRVLEYRSLSLTLNTLSGTIPLEWDAFRDMTFVQNATSSIVVLLLMCLVLLLCLTRRYFDVSSNLLSGTVPSSLLAAMPFLSTLSIGNNSLRLPSSFVLSSLSLLSELYLHQLGLMGTLPTDFGNMRNLRWDSFS